MNVGTLIAVLQQHARPEDDVFITIRETLMLSDPKFEHPSTDIDLCHDTVTVQGDD
jgi:hypothetical protein